MQSAGRPSQIASSPQDERTYRLGPSKRLATSRYPERNPHRHRNQKLHAPSWMSRPHAYLRRRSVRASSSISRGDSGSVPGMILTWLTKYRDFGLLLLRLGLGGMFVFVHGWPKIQAGAHQWKEIGS